MRFFYYYPTWDKPSGGNKQLRLQALLLRELGVETFLLRDEYFFTRGESFDDDTLYGIPIPIASVPFERAQEILAPDDVLILPEVLLDRSLIRCAGWAVRIAVNNQNGFYGIQHSPSRSISRKRIEFAIANASYVADLCVRGYGLNRNRVFLIPYWIDRPPFQPAQTDTELAIGYMPRKLAPLTAAVQKAISQTNPDVAWVEIDGLPEPEVAAHLRRCRIFFAAQDHEGFGMPAVEAMACGCLVAGFPGTGAFPHPYANAKNGLWARDGDCANATIAVTRAIELARIRGKEYDAIRTASAQTLARYTRETASEALAELATTVASGNYPARLGPLPVLGLRHQRALLRLRYDHNRLGLLGRLVSWVSRVSKPIRSRKPIAPPP